MISLDKLSVRYGELVALNNISLHIDHGEHVAIIGPSGAGKSTLLREIYRSIDQGANLIQQQFALVPQLAVFHNVYIGQLHQRSFWENLRNLVKPHPQREKEITAILTELGIEKKINTPVSQLSGGEQQRVAIARAMYHGGNILLGDEPISSVDPHNSELIMQKLSTSSQTFVFSVHHVETALQYASRIIGMKEGKIVFDAKPATVERSLINTLYAPC